MGGSGGYIRLVSQSENSGAGIGAACAGSPNHLCSSTHRNGLIAVVRHQTMKRETDSENGSAKRNHVDKPAEYTSSEIKEFFNQKLWDEKFQSQLESQVSLSQPYRWGTITDLMDPQLLKNVRNEVLLEIAFTKKETDIYKVFQSGDLANLSGLNWDDLSRLPSLYKLRAAIYSEEFRDMISGVTKCGKLSGLKTDMSINTYNKGCHLLTHDDVIGSRRLSFILYLPEPGKKWKSSYGGALRLFPAVVPNVPHTDYLAKLVPQFNQIAFFTVQPGLSFHDVEEVREDRQRLSIQGWFHIPQPGEPGYVKGEQEATEARSTLQQLQSKELQEYDFPKPVRNDFSPLEVETLLEKKTLSADETEYLSKFLNVEYLKPGNLERLQTTFLDESIVELTNIFNAEYAKVLHRSLRHTELETDTPQTSKDIQFPWKCAVPPHKQRYMYIDGTSTLDMSEKGVKFANAIGPSEAPNFSVTSQAHQLSDTDRKLCEISSFIKSRAFRKWLVQVTGLVPTSDQVLARRFRPGHDFILATTTEKDLARENELNLLLEATFNLTPTAANSKTWALGEFGGYELCMHNDDEQDEDDPAIYRGGNDDSSVLYTGQCQWNTLCLMLRDPTVLKFVKYVSVNAKGSRWDISCQWNVQGEEEAEEEN